MRLAIKAALLSGLVFPGLGQVYLKRYIRGIVYVIVTLIPLIVVVADLTRLATLALDNLAARGTVIDMTTISDAATHAATDASGLRIDLMLILMFGCWLVAVVDAFRLGKQRDHRARTRVVPPDHDGAPPLSAE